MTEETLEEKATLLDRFAEVSAKVGNQVHLRSLRDAFATMTPIYILAGIAVLGPLGVVAGAFVHGKNVDLPAGTELYIQTKSDTTLFGVQTTYDSAAPFQRDAAPIPIKADSANDQSVYHDAA